MKTYRYVVSVLLPLFFLILVMVLRSSSLSGADAGDEAAAALAKSMTVTGVISFLAFGTIQTFLVYLFFGRPHQSHAMNISGALEKIGDTVDSKDYDRVLELYKSVVTDPSSGAVIFKHFTAILDKEMVRADRYKLPFSIMKVAVKSRGELDAARRKAGDIIIRVLRTIDIVSINDSGDFVILLPNTRKRNADLAVRRILARLKVVEDASGGPSFTLSFGIATYADDGVAAHVLLQKADANLDRARLLGDNKVVF